MSMSVPACVLCDTILTYRNWCGTYRENKVFLCKKCYLGKMDLELKRKRIERMVTVQ